MPDADKERLLKEACTGISVLLVLDDVWEVEHTRVCLPLDPTTRSKIVISTRVQGVLETHTANTDVGDGSTIALCVNAANGLRSSLMADVDVHEITVPSQADAVRMLLIAAGVNSDVDERPTESDAIVRFCKRLPLALGIAGKRLRHMAMGSNGKHRWDDVTAVLERELAASGHAQSIEHTVIQVSLNSIDPLYRAQVVRLFCSLGLVREDRIAPLEIIELLYVDSPLFVNSDEFVNITMPALALARSFCSYV